jgi:poly-gamma-glutamate synthesis protein (capsule biosynthesis protein)
MPTLAVVGDVMLGRGVSAEIRRRPPESFWGTTLPVLQAADAVFANLECAITRHGRRWSRTPKVFHFQAIPEAIAVLRAGNVRAVSLANNHVLDFETEGLLDTLRLLDQAGITHAGAGRNLEEASRPALLEVGGITLALLSATDNEPPFAAGPEQPGVWYLDLGADPAAVQDLVRGARAARQVGGQLVVVALHWGPNMVEYPPQVFRRAARRLIETADLVWGHSAHVFQGVERVGSRLVLYDTGDFVDDYVVDPDLRNDWSFIFLLDVEGTRIVRLRLLPVRLRYAQVDLATGEEARAICDRMIARSAPFDTCFARSGEGLELVLNPGET